jgi:hypothetical protein
MIRAGKQQSHQLHNGAKKAFGVAQKQAKASSEVIAASSAGWRTALANAQDMERFSLNLM